MQSLTNPKSLFRWLARPRLLHWLLPYLMLLVLAGTVAQKYAGLYDSQRRYFSSFLFWWGIVPLPGARAVTGLLFVSLLAKLILASPWKKATAGIFIAHLGALTLLLGGLVTALFGHEGYVALAKGENAGRFFDYHHRVLTISKNGQALREIPIAALPAGAHISDPALPFAIHIDDACRNCTMAARGDSGTDFKGSAGKVKLAGIPGEMEDERNFAGMQLTVSGAGAASGTYITFEPMPVQAIFDIGQDHYELALGRKPYALPFSLQLQEAKEELHPGTDLPKSYTSAVRLSDGALTQRAVITMNHPLRYKGYTVYQSSFNETADGGLVVSFAVVQNSGRVFPYVASITLCIGLLIHLCLRLPVLLRRGEHAE